MFGLVPFKDDRGKFGADYVRVWVSFGPQVDVAAGSARVHRNDSNMCRM